MADSTTFSLNDALNSLTKLATPFANQWLYGKQTASDLALIQARQEAGLTNGSAAVDPALAISSSPNGVLGFLFGTNAGATPSSGGTLVLVAAAIGLVLWLIFRHR